MTATQELISIVEQLPEPSIQEVVHFAEFLRERTSRTSTTFGTASETSEDDKPSAFLRAARSVIAEEQPLLRRLGD